jgi:hypothetical protein
VGATTAPSGGRRDDDEESAPPVSEPSHVPLVKTTLPFYSLAAEAEVVKAIVPRHILKDDFINGYAFQSCERFAREQGRGGSAGGCL